MKNILNGLLAMIIAFSLAGCSAVDKVNETASSAGSETKEETGTVTPAGSAAEEKTETAAGDVVLPNDKGLAEGYVGNTMRSVFFDFTVNSAALTDDYQGIKPAEGKKLLVVNLTIKNTTKSSLPMFDTDFYLYQGGDEENSKYIDAITAADATLKADGMLESEYQIGINETVTGDIVYEVPQDQKDFILAFDEYFENEEYGDTFAVYFTAK